MVKNSILEITIHDVQADEITTRPMNDDELKQAEIDQVNANAANQTKEKAEQEKAALLVRLGITEDEAKLLLG